MLSIVSHDNGLTGLSEFLVAKLSILSVPVLPLQIEPSLTSRQIQHF
jgi:hypothetical protein